MFTANLIFCFGRKRNKKKNKKPDIRFRYKLDIVLYFHFRCCHALKVPPDQKHSFVSQGGVFIAVPALVAEKAMATHSSILAWKIPGSTEPGGLPSMGLHRVKHD